MKAKDLAALAALGIAGKMAYDKFGNKAPAAKRPMGQGLDMTNQGAYERANIPSADATDESSGMPAYQGRTANRVGDIEADTDYPAPRVAPRQPPAVSRSLAPAAVAADDYVMPRTAAKQLPDASRVTPYNSDTMYNTTVKSDPNVPHDDEMNRLARTRATRQGAIVAQTPNDQAQARILRQGAVMPQPAVNAQAQARLLRQGAPAASYAKGGVISSKTSKPSGASRGDGIAQRGKTRGKYL